MPSDYLLLRTCRVQPSKKRHLYRGSCGPVLYRFTLLYSLAVQAAPIYPTRPSQTTMSAWIDTVKHSPTNFDTQFSWKEYIQTSIKTIAISLIAMAISTVVMIILEIRLEASPESAGYTSMCKLCLAFAGSGIAVTGVDWVFGGSD